MELVAATVDPIDNIIRNWGAQFSWPAEYHQYRKAIYQLYPLLNHLNLFGAEYVKPLMAQVEKVSAVV